MTPDDVVVELISGAKELPEATGSADEGTEEEIVVCDHCLILKLSARTVAQLCEDADAHTRDYCWCTAINI